jgi:hypothetical protein
MYILKGGNKRFFEHKNRQKLSFVLESWKTLEYFHAVEVNLSNKMLLVPLNLSQYKS